MENQTNRQVLTIDVRGADPDVINERISKICEKYKNNLVYDRYRDGEPSIDKHSEK